MAPATAASPDPAEPPVNTITSQQWQALLARGILPGAETVYTDLPSVTRRLAQDRQREQRGSN